MFHVTVLIKSILKYNFPKVDKDLNLEELEKAFNSILKAFSDAFPKQISVTGSGYSNRPFDVYESKGPITLQYFTMLEKAIFYVWEDKEKTKLILEVIADKDGNLRGLNKLRFG
jgi:hypothetical protein